MSAFLPKYEQKIVRISALYKWNEFESKFKIKLKMILIYKTISLRVVLAILYVGK